MSLLGGEARDIVGAAKQDDAGFGAVALADAVQLINCPRTISSSEQTINSVRWRDDELVSPQRLDNRSIK